MGRAAVVIAVAAFDDYHTRRFSEALVPCLKKKGPTDELVELLGKAGVTLKDALELLSMERPHRRIRKHIDSYLSDLTTQRFISIDSLFGALGLRDFSSHVERKAGRKRMRRSIEKLVLRRHDIVHSGDLSQNGKLQELNPDDALMRMRLMREFVTHADQIIYNCVKQRNCMACLLAQVTPSSASYSYLEPDYASVLRKREMAMAMTATPRASRAAHWGQRIPIPTPFRKTPRMITRM